MTPSDGGKSFTIIDYLGNIQEVGLQSLQVRRAAEALMVVAAEAAVVVDPAGAGEVAECWIWPSSTAPSPPRSAPGTWVAI